MLFKTEIKPPFFDFKINHQDRIMMLGSCFAENISEQMKLSGFNVNLNPFGIAYNPGSIAENIRNLLRKKEYSTSDLFEYQGIYHSFDHHGKFSSTSQDACLKHINRTLSESYYFIKEASLLIITLGTAFVYKRKASGKIVSNCHKLPEKEFLRYRLDVDEILEDWNSLIFQLRTVNPGIKILFTVSPIRHWKDGAHENQLSKATLLLAIDKLIKQYSECYYFPSYEIMMDDLRDYRFYADDMLHPSDVAVSYIWEIFSQSFFDKKTISLIEDWRKLQQALNHRPINPESDQYLAFKLKTAQKLETFLKENPVFFCYKND